MKNRFLWMGLISICCFSCQNDAPEIAHQDIDARVAATIQNGHLAFKNDAAYEAFLSRDGKEKQNIINAIRTNSSFISFKSVQPGKTSSGGSRLIGTCEVPDSVVENNDEFFSTINQDGIVEIEGTLYKYDYCSDGVFVISSGDAENPDQYENFRRGTRITDVVGFFPSYVDAIDAVASGYKTMPDSSTVEGNEVFAKTGIFGAVAKEHFFVYNNPKSLKEYNLFDGKLAYDKFAIYFHFYGKEKYQTPCFFNWCTTTLGPRDWKVSFQYWYRRKGRSYDNSGSGTVTPEGSKENKADKTFYSGNRGLRRGCAQWDVENVYARGGYIERNGGAHWFQMGSISYSDFRYINNFYFTNPNFVNPNHFYMCF